MNTNPLAEINDPSTLELIDTLKPIVLMMA
jgi:hypothetical protein